jgi:hypothetical protein
MSIMSLKRRLAAAGGATLLLSALAVGSAAAKPVDRGSFHDVSSEVIEDFCGDLTVREDVDIRGTFLVNARGRDGILYFHDNVHGTISWTNLATGKSLTQVFNTVSKDHKITDNGDGTFTILVLATGGGKILGPDGKLLFSDAGQVRFAFVVDFAGTPTDPSDDVFIEDLGLVKGSTGTNDLEGRDFCEDMHEFTS